MIAYIIITKMTSSAICNKGTIARTIAFKTTCKPANKKNIVSCMGTFCNLNKSSYACPFMFKFRIFLKILK